MKKKLLIILIISMFLFTSLTTLSVNAFQVKNTTNTKTKKLDDPLPDLQAKIRFIGKYVHVCIYNMGEATLPKNTKFLWTLTDSTGKLYSTVLAEVPWDLKTGRYYKTGGPVISILEDYGKTFIVTLDPPESEVYSLHPELGFDPDPIHGVIFESNEDNNQDSKRYTLSRSLEQNLEFPNLPNKLDDDPELPDYIWHSKIFFRGKNLKINGIPYEGKEKTIKSDGDLDNIDWIRFDYDDDSWFALVFVWIPLKEKPPYWFMRIPVPIQGYKYGKVELANFNGKIRPGLVPGSYIISGETYGNLVFFDKD